MIRINLGKKTKSLLAGLTITGTLNFSSAQENEGSGLFCLMHKMLKLSHQITQKT